jgi:hypothetical protein
MPTVVPGEGPPTAAIGKSATDFDPDASLLKHTCKNFKLDAGLATFRKTQCRDTSRKTTQYEVLDPGKTFELLRQGASIFRFGDGELRLMQGVESINHGMELGSKAIVAYLRAAAALGGHPHPNGPCVGLVPSLDGNASRFRAGHTWVNDKSYKTTTMMCFPVGRYCSASITRPDHLVEWDFDGLAAGWASVFAGKTILYIRPSGIKLDPSSARMQALNIIFKDAQAVLKPDFLNTGTRHFAQRQFIMDFIHEELRKTRIDIVVLSLGPTATIIAAELACQGVQALDFGSLSGKVR